MTSNELKGNKIMLKRVCLHLVFAIGFIFAGVNENAVFHVDMVPTTVEVESTYTDTLLNQNFEVAVWVEDVVDLKGFAVRLKIDTAKYTYFDCSEDGHSRKNILDGGMFFNDNQEDKIELVGALQGTSSPDTSGLIGFFTFTSKLGWGDSVQIEFFDATLIAISDEEDAFTAPSSALIAGTYTVKQQVIPQCTITVIQTPNGSITPAGPVLVNQGEDSPEFVITPSQNYKIVDVLIDGVSAGPISTYTFLNVTENHEITATFDLTTAVVQDEKVNSVFFANGTVSGMGNRVEFFYSGQRKGNGVICIYDLLGKQIHEICFTLPELSNKHNPVLVAQWDLLNSYGKPVSNGCYLISCRINSDYFIDKIGINRN